MAPDRSWRVTRAAAATPALALLFLAIFVVCVEGTARTESVRARLLAPSVGCLSRPFEVQLARFETWVRRHGRPDCVFLGSSLVLTGIEPDVFAAAFERAGGDRIRCFNLAVPGMTASDTRALAAIVAQDYRPWLLVYGTSFRDFNAAVTGPGLNRLPWVQYRRGHISPEGWLVDRSRAYRYYLTYRGWSDVTERRHMSRQFPGADNGFWPGPSAPAASDESLAGARSIIEREIPPDRIAARHLGAFRELLAMQAEGPQILVVEMPGSAALAEHVSRSDAYRRFRARLQREARRGHATLWEVATTIPAGVLPADGWRDAFHMSTSGAEALSRWLGARVAEAVRAGTLRPPAPSPQAGTSSLHDSPRGAGATRRNRSAAA
jgi:hypothetical protein